MFLYPGQLFAGRTIPVTPVFSSDVCRDSNDGGFRPSTRLSHLLYIDHLIFPIQTVSLYLYHCVLNPSYQVLMTLIFVFMHYYLYVIIHYILYLI